MIKQRISITYNLKWEFIDNPHYKISTCRKVINTRTGRELKQTINGSYSRGYWIGNYFVTIGNINKKVRKIEDCGCPF